MAGMRDVRVARLEASATNVEAVAAELAAVVKSLGEAKHDLRNHEHVVTGLRNRISGLEADRTRLMERMREAAGMPKPRPGVEE